jgi:parvulin-like peptidyl-prolyl isomerase
MIWPLYLSFSLAIVSPELSMAKLKDKYKGQIMMRKLVNNLITSRVNITPTQISAYYYGNQEDFIIPKLTHFKILLLKPTDERNIYQTEQLALYILERINKGEDFDLLVKEYSQGPNKDKGGDMGYMARGSMIKEIEDAIAGLKPGESSGIIKAPNGINIIKIVDIKESEVKSLSDMEDSIRQRLFQREAELTLREFVDKLKKDAYIKIKEY